MSFYEIVIPLMKQYFKQININFKLKFKSILNIKLKNI